MKKYGKFVLDLTRVVYDAVAALCIWTMLIGNYTVLAFGLVMYVSVAFIVKDGKALIASAAPLIEEVTKYIAELKEARNIETE